jgi:hypothetical protein
MRITKWMFGFAALLVTSPVFGSTYWAGFEDDSGSQADYDYNDLVFSIGGSSLSLHTSTGLWFNETSAGVLNTGGLGLGPTGTPFWNNASNDGPGGFNIGWCVWGGGACNGGAGAAPLAQYLAASNGGSVSDVYFSTMGAVDEEVTLSMASDIDSLGWELVSGVGGIHLFSPGVQGPETFMPGGDFVLIGDVRQVASFNSDIAAPDGLSHFAFFAAANAPEPSTIALISFALLVSTGIFRKQIRRRQSRV